ncbi:DUF3791 domain-containing protein [Anaerovibrio sp.]|uniref:DUF3791 domain-containing protein n=1 Tax=Anaerovibrio sp. TaxID=1872532 RepID=UPI0038908AA5
MNERTQIIFMQVRIIRLASKAWNMSINDVMRIFNKFDILGYIEAGFGIFHCEGDEAILEDISELLADKGMKL